MRRGEKILEVTPDSFHFDLSHKTESVQDERDPSETRYQFTVTFCNLTEAQIKITGRQFCYHVPQGSVPDGTDKVSVKENITLGPGCAIEFQGEFQWTSPVAFFSAAIRIQHGESHFWVDSKEFQLTDSNRLH